MPTKPMRPKVRQVHVANRYHDSVPIVVGQLAENVIRHVVVAGHKIDHALNGLLIGNESPPSRHLRSPYRDTTPY